MIQEFVLAACSIGERNLTILRRHAIPNALVATLMNLLVLLIFVRKAMRDALDPRRAAAKGSDQGAGLVGRKRLDRSGGNRCVSQVVNHQQSRSVVSDQSTLGPTSRRLTLSAKTPCSSLSLAASHSCRCGQSSRSSGSCPFNRTDTWL